MSVESIALWIGTNSSWRITGITGTHNSIFRQDCRQKDPHRYTPLSRL